MDESRPVAEMVAAAASGTAAASRRAGVEVRELTELGELQQATSLLSTIWGRPSTSPTIETDMLRAFALTGNYVAGAWRGSDLVGAATGIHGRNDNGIYLHSVVTGVAPSDQTRHIGFALKQHQRAWALARGIDLITWTFDPLVRRNAWFNLTRLGAEVTGYHENLYGPMDDAINRGDETDRCVVSWRLTGARANAAATGSLERSDPPDAVRILAEATNGEPVCAAPAAGAVLLAWVPEDIAALRLHHPDKARAWRSAARATLGRAIADGYTATAMLRSGWYVLEPRP